MTSTMPGQAHVKAVVDSSLSRLVACQRARSLDSVVALFTDDAMLFGSARQESAVGIEKIRDYYRNVFALSVTIGWTWEEVIAQGDDATISFVALGSYDIRGPGEVQTDRGGYRIAGVLRRTGEQWKFALFSGCQPTDTTYL